MELPRKSTDIDFDVFQRRNPHRLLNADCRCEAGEPRQSVADAIGRAYDASMDQHCDQKPGIEQQLQQRQQDDRAECPVEERDHWTRKLGREHRTRRKLAPPVKLQRDQDERRRPDLDRERQL